MNIYSEYESFFGKAEVSFLRRCSEELLELAGSIRRQLGKQAYLLDNYLAGILKGIGMVTAFDAADRGGSVCGELGTLCASILDGSDKHRDHPFYRRAQEYITGHPLKYQERFTRHNVYDVALLDSYMEYAVEQYTDYLKERQYIAYDIVYLRDLFRQITTLLGEETPMEQLNMLIHQRFQVVTPMRAFIQGMTENLLFSLTYRDTESNKQIFQLLLDQRDGGCA